MNAIQFDVSVPRYLAGKLLGAVHQPFYWSGLSCLRYGQVPEPTLPGPDWVKVKTRYGGICGSDWNMVHLHESLYLSPFGSELAKYPFQGELARHYGANEVVLLSRDRAHYQALARLTGAKVYQPFLGKPALVGGADVVYECVGNDSSVDDALLTHRFRLDEYRQAFRTLAAKGANRVFKAVFSYE